MKMNDEGSYAMDLPAEVRSAKNWLVWSLKSNGDKKPRKVPHYPAGGARIGVQGSPEDRAQLTSLEVALRAVSQGGYSGVGWAALPELDIVALDFDNCVDANGVVHPDVEALVSNTYAELSPSGTGVRAFMRGSLEDCKSHTSQGWDFGFEVFSHKGFVTVTGRVLDICRLLRNERTLSDLTPEIQSLYEARFSTSKHSAEGSKDFTREISLRGVTAETMADLRDAVLNGLSQSRAEGYHGAAWVDVGLALKSLQGTDFAADALQLWHEFSARSKQQYDASECATKWEGFRPGQITYKSIFEWAQADGWVNPRKGGDILEDARQRAVRIGREGERVMPVQRVMTGTEMLEELVFLADGSRVSFVNDPRFVLTLTDFKQFAAGSMEEVNKKGEKTVITSRVKLWVSHPERKTVRTQTFAPGQPAVCMSPKNEQAQNLWLPKVRQVPDNWQRLAQPFFDHVAYLIPIVEERERFLDWVAHIEQAPGVLPSTHYLLVTKQTGIGRNWMAYALAQVFAGHTALGFDLGASLKSGFNGELSQTLLAVVDELHEGGPTTTSRPQAEKLKSLLTETTRNINPKYGRQHIEYNACRFLMLSNHEAALPLTENDRRVIVVQNPGVRKSADYYRELYALLADPDLGDALAEAFKRRDISLFNPGEIAPMNEAKARTIRAGRSEVEQAVRDLAAEWPSECITAGRLGIEVNSSLGGRLNSTQGAGVAAGLLKYGSRVKVHGRSQHIWILRNPERWARSAPVEVAREAVSGETAADVDGSPENRIAGEIFQ